MGAIKTPDLYACAVSINGVLDLLRLIDESGDYIGGRVWVRHMGLEGESAKAVSPLHLADQIRIPMLIVQAADDVTVPKRHGQAMAERLRKLDRDVEYIELERGGHRLTDLQARTRVLQALESFLERHTTR